MSNYANYIDLKYTPSKNDLVCTFYVEPRKNMKEAAGAVAAESSTGTWTKLTTMSEKKMVKLGAKVFEIKDKIIKIAYPSELFEKGNMPQICSSIAGNIFGMKEVKNLRLLDFELPRNLLNSFKGPQFGIKGVRKIVKVKNRPLCGTIVKPKLGLTAKQHAKVAYEAWIGGIDIVKDDENLTNQKFNKFKKRLEETVKLKEKAEKETGEVKIYMPNISAETFEMLERAKMVKDLENEYVMVDILTIGWSALQTVRNKMEELKRVIHAHRAMHAAVTRNKKHGITMKVIAKTARIIGVDQLHIGTAIGKMEGKADEIKEIEKAITEPLGKFKPVFPVNSGGLQPGDVPALVKLFGKDIIIQAGGGVHGHPSGTRAGAKAMRQAIEAAMKGISLKEYAKTHKELKEAIKKWGVKYGN